MAVPTGPTVKRIEGTITTSDGETRCFLITDEGYSQWGNTPYHLGATVDALSDMVAALVDGEHFTVELGG